MAALERAATCFRPAGEARFATYAAAVVWRVRGEVEAPAAGVPAQACKVLPPPCGALAGCQPPGKTASPVDALTHYACFNPFLPDPRRPCSAQCTTTRAPCACPRTNTLVSALPHPAAPPAPLLPARPDGGAWARVFPAAGMLGRAPHRLVRVLSSLGSVASRPRAPTPSLRSPFPQTCGGCGGQPRSSAKSWAGSQAARPSPSAAASL